MNTNVVGITENDNDLAFFVFLWILSEFDLKNLRRLKHLKNVLNHISTKEIIIVRL
ncbi:hypothetical protein H1P_300027 [Hyella patelloides LEGE 07179]|uniref:Uncharacterized protein n=1 Tax=Hyella patelloides LEGE 07179 TaxID=945734 RepID=A0A563VUC6_9CYAN|nr:hypothetical protein H1P_300027 [Hyella patelloides LEGE 07179]